MINSLIKETQDKNIPLSSLLLKTKVLASKKNDSEFLKWLDCELEGYETTAPCPKYRRLYGQVKFWDPTLGWCLIVIDASATEGGMLYRPTIQSIGEIEKLLQSNSPDFRMHYPADIASKLMEPSEFKTEVALFIDASSLVGVLDKVRNSLLDWLLKVEKEDSKRARSYCFQ